MIKIIDNFLDPNEFEAIKNSMESGVRNRKKLQEYFENSKDFYSLIISIFFPQFLPFGDLEYKNEWRLLDRGLDSIFCNDKHSYHQS